MGLNILNDPTSYSQYIAWTETAKQSSNVMNFSLDELWVVMKDSSDDVVRNAANNIEDAFKYIVSHPQPYSTAATLSIESDWAEFGILSPSTVIVLDPTNPLPTMTYLSQTKVLWGKERSHDQRREIVKWAFLFQLGHELTTV